MHHILNISYIYSIELFFIDFRNFLMVGFYYDNEITENCEQKDLIPSSHFKYKNFYFRNILHFSLQ